MSKFRHAFLYGFILAAWMLSAMMGFRESLKIEEVRLAQPETTILVSGVRIQVRLRRPFHRPYRPYFRPPYYNRPYYYRTYGNPYRYHYEKSPYRTY